VTGPESTREDDRGFLNAWRADLLERAWEALAREERRTGRPLHLVLHFRAAHPELRSAQVAERLGARVGREFTADRVRKWLHAGRERFAELLMLEVAASLRAAEPDAVELELIDLELFPYCKVALDRWRERWADG
jgi:hypothetical protein